MKLKKAKIVIKSPLELKAEWKQAIRGEKKSLQQHNVVIFTNLESVAKVFSKSRIEILQTIVKEKPHSIYELAKILNRDFKNVHTDVRILNEIGLVELKENENNRTGLTPIALFSGIELDWAA